MKWCSLPYEESTWELEEDVDPGKVKEFESLQILPDIKSLVRIRETPTMYKKIKCIFEWKRSPVN